MLRQARSAEVVLAVCAVHVSAACKQAMLSNFPGAAANRAACSARALAWKLLEADRTRPDALLEELGSLGCIAREQPGQQPLCLPAAALLRLCRWC